MRTAQLQRDTYETKIHININLDGKGKSNIVTGIGFFDHMLTHVAKHGFLDLDLKAEGDLQVDFHHSI